MHVPLSRLQSRRQRQAAPRTENLLMMRETVGRPMEILLVEDNLSDAQLTYEFLNRTHIHHRLTMLWNGAEALDFLHRRGVFVRGPRPDLILLDLVLRIWDGRALLAELKAGDWRNGLPFSLVP